MQDQDVSRVEGGVIYWDKDSNLKTVKLGLFGVNEEGSMMLVNWQQCLENKTKYRAKIN